MRRAARYLAISSKKSTCALKKKLSRGANASMSRPGGERRLDVREPVGERERELLRGRRARFADVVAGDRDRVPAGELGGGEAHDVGDEAHRRARREDELLLRLVLLQDVVLDRAAEARAVDARADRRRATYIASSVGAAELMVIDVLTAPRSMPAKSSSMSASVSIATPARPTSPTRELVVGVAPQQRRHVERGREAAPAGGEQLRGTARWCPRRCRSRRTGAWSRASERYIEAYGPRVYGYTPGRSASAGAVHRVELDARHGREGRGPFGRGCESLLPLVTCGVHGQRPPAELIANTILVGIDYGFVLGLRTSAPGRASVSSPSSTTVSPATIVAT